MRARVAGVVCLLAVLAAPPAWAGWEIANDGSCTGVRAYIGARLRSVLHMVNVVFHRQMQSLDAATLTASLRPDDVGVRIFVAEHAISAGINPVAIANVPLGLACRQVGLPPPDRYGDRANPARFDDRPNPGP